MDVLREEITKNDRRNGEVKVVDQRKSGQRFLGKMLRECMEKIKIWLRIGGVNTKGLPHLREMEVKIEMKK